MYERERSRANYKREKDNENKKKEKIHLDAFAIQTNVDVTHTFYDQLHFNLNCLSF